MARSPKSFKRYSWDSCSWIAGIWQEIKTVNGVIENRGAMCNAVITDAEKGAVEIYTSALALAEVCKHPEDDNTPSAGGDKLKAYFENDYIIIIPLDRRVGEMARDLMRQGHSGLKPPDATHLAAALVANVDELHTFDDKLLNLDEKLARRDGVKLRICKPSMGGPPLPLLDALNETADEGAPAAAGGESADHGEAPKEPDSMPPVPLRLRTHKGDSGSGDFLIQRLQREAIDGTGSFLAERKPVCPA